MTENLHIGPMIKLLNKEFELLHAEKSNAMGLTPAQLFVMHYIAKNQNVNICHRDIEKQFELSHATVSGIISRLEAKGFVVCTADDADRRFKIISVTDKAKCCEKEMKSHIDRYEQQLVSGFSYEEKEKLVEFILRMIKNVEADADLPFRIPKEED